MSSDTSRRTRRYSQIMLLPLVMFAGLGAFFFWGLFNNDDRLPSALIGQPVPKFTLPPIEGREDGLSSADLTGHVSHEFRYEPPDTALFPDNAAAAGYVCRAWRVFLLGAL